MDRARTSLSAEHGIDEVMKANNLDAILFPTGLEAPRSPLAATRR
jgi:hypothetical protein